ncbi:MAG TPA: DNRLRE domain-containing protein, partial [Saprospiraceae bacterium]
MKKKSIPALLSIGFLLLHSFSIQAATINVYVYNTEFSINPPGEPVVSATITQGDFIKWIWLQGGHTTTSVVGSPEQWNQPINSTNTEYIHQFNTIGVFVYYCIPHGSDNGDGTASGMFNTITVLPAGSGACCLPDGICITTTEGGCLTQEGFFSGTGTLCDTTYCEVTSIFTAIKDNILYESANGGLSNGQGIHLYTGNNNVGRRRSVVAFDLSAVPDGAELQDAQLQLFCNSSSGITFPVTAHRVLEDWGEGNSDASGNEGSGDQAEPGDATWLYTFYDTEEWSTQGGTFSNIESASTDISSQGTVYTWSSMQMDLDVSHWLQVPAENFGWVLRGDENTTTNTKRFSSRQNGTSDNDPRLVLHYVVPPTGACCSPDGTCENKTENQCMIDGGEYHGNGTSCEEVNCSIQLTPYLDPLPLPGVAVPVTGQQGGAAHYRIEMTEQFQQLHSELPPTRVWGYNGSYPGPTIEAFRDSLVTVQWVNNLRVAET